MRVALTIICYLFTDQIVSVFLTDATAFDYAAQFARILLTTSFLFGVFYVLTNALQAMGTARSRFSGKRDCIAGEFFNSAIFSDIQLVNNVYIPEKLFQNNCCSLNRSHG